MEVKEEKPQLVLVAAANLPAGTTITSGSLRWQAWPESGVEESNELVQPFIGSIVRRGMVAGMPITRTMVFKRDEPGFLAGILDPGRRAVAITVTPESSAAGFILPGDRVDVVLTHDVRRDVQISGSDTPVIADEYVRFTSETVLRDVRIIAIDQQFDDFEDKATVAKTVTLEVTPKQAEILAVASSMGKLSLTMRALSMEAEPEEVGSFTTDLHISPTLTATFGEAAKAKAKAKGNCPGRSGPIKRRGDERSGFRDFP